MGPDGEPHEDASGSDGSSDSSVSGTSSPSASPAPPSPPPAPPPPPHSHPPANAVTIASQSSGPSVPPAALPLHPHLFHQHQQQRTLLSLHLASPSTTSSAPAPATTPAPPAAPAPERPVRDDCWSENATFTLIQAWGDRYLELNRGNLKQQHWKDVANSVNSRPLTSSKPPKTDIQCKNRIDTLKKKYKVEKNKLATGGAPSKWAFFDRLDELIGSSKKPNSAKTPRASGAGGDSNSLADPDGICATAMATATATAISATKLTTAEEKVKPSLPFILPLPPTQGTPLPPFNHFGGTVTHVNHHAALAGSTMNLHLGAGAYLSHHVGGGTNMNQHAEGSAHINYHHGGGGNNISHALSVVPVSQHAGNGATADTTSKSKGGQDMSQSSPHNTMQADGKRHKRKRDGKRCKEGSPFRDLARAILKFGEMYEKVEIAKQHQMVELEKQRMEFTKDLELQRMQLFAQTQIEIAKIRHGRSSNHSNMEHQL